MTANDLPDTMRVLRVVVHEAILEEKRIRRAFVEFLALSALVVVLLAIDYKIASVMFSVLDPSFGDVSLGPAFLALSVPVAVIVIHLLVSEDEGHTIEHRLRRLAGVGVFVFLFGIAAMVSLVYLDASEGVGTDGSSGIQGTIGDEDIGLGGGEPSWSFALFRALFASLSPMIFFAGMTLILFVTVYACHRLMTKIEERYEFFANTTKRARELQRLFAEAETRFLDIRKAQARLKILKDKLPGDPEYKFSRVASAAIGDALQRMGRALRSLDECDGVMAGVFTRKAVIPAHIETRAEGRKVITEIRHQTTPYAILKELDGFPPKEED